MAEGVAFWGLRVHSGGALAHFASPKSYDIWAVAPKPAEVVLHPLQYLPLTPQKW
jgi:hypothetical protein